MRARAILQHGAFGPDDLDRLQRAFELAWGRVEAKFSAEEADTQRNLLAAIVVTAGNVSGLDAEELAASALRSFSSILAAGETMKR